MPKESTGMQHALAIDREEIVQIYKLIRPHVRRTPVIEVDGADFGLAGDQHCSETRTAPVFGIIQSAWRYGEPDGAECPAGGSGRGFRRKSRSRRCICRSSPGKAGADFCPEGSLCLEDRTDSRLWR